MNVVVLMSDQHRWDTAGCCGHSIVKTPHIDSLAGRGVRFTNVFTVSPLCIPSRAAWHTSTYPHTNGVFNHPSYRHRSGKTWEPHLSDATPDKQTEPRAPTERSFASKAIWYGPIAKDANVAIPKTNLARILPSSKASHASQ